MAESMMTEELTPYAAEMKLSRRWFEQARQCVLTGKAEAAQHCLDRGLAVLDRVEAAILTEREKQEVPA